MDTSTGSPVAEIYRTVDSRYDELSYGVDLQVSGHTHGGQMVPFNLLVKLQQPIVSGYGEGEFAATGAMTVARSGAVVGPTSIEGYAFAAGGGAATAEAYRFPTIRTDKDDYAPGQLATITGSGLQADE